MNKTVLLFVALFVVCSGLMSFQGPVRVLGGVLAITTLLSMIGYAIYKRIQRR